MLFDLIRNGLADQYQQIILHLSDGTVYVSLGGPNYEQSSCKCARTEPAVTSPWNIAGSTSG
jgi:hypothetical protein